MSRRRAPARRPRSAGPSSKGWQSRSDGEVEWRLSWRTRVPSFECRLGAWIVIPAVFLNTHERADWNNEGRLPGGPTRPGTGEKSLPKGGLVRIQHGKLRGPLPA